MPDQETHFDAIIVGSGFGGSVSAYRLAEAGLRVCVLERGKPYPPGSFARTPHDMRTNFWDPSAGLHGLFDIWSFRGLEALVSAGLGGGSLIYANVLIRKDEKWFVREDRRAGTYEYWPVSRADLDPHYDQVEKILKPTPYPLDKAPYSGTPKTNAFREAAGKAGLDWQLPNLAVTFANGDDDPVPGEPIDEEVRNLHDRTRYTCRLVGECDVGCNFGSKNSVDFNYLSLAMARHGAEIRTRCEVRSFAPRERGYVVRYVEHRPEDEGKALDTGSLPLKTLTADKLILSAGTLGTPFLLLKNSDSFDFGPALGSRFCGNGDLLSFVMRPRHGRDGKMIPWVIQPSVGPVITSTVRVPDSIDGDGGDGRGFYIQEGGYPAFASWMQEALDLPGVGRRGARFLITRVWDQLTRRPHSNLSATISQVIGTTVRSTGTLPMLGMGRDTPDGVMRLQKGFLQVDWTTETSERYFNGVRSRMADLARALGGDFVENPLWRLKRVVTVHPLGGAPMGRDQQEGVVDSYGQVFGYPGLHVADGSIMPGPVGPNPSLTIAALADRGADRLLGQV